MHDWLTDYWRMWSKLEVFWKKEDKYEASFRDEECELKKKKSYTEARPADVKKVDEATEVCIK